MRKQTAHRKIIFLLGIFLFLAHSSFAVEPLPAKTNEPAPQFTLSDAAGKEISLSDFAGKPVILFFWATWCPFCREELPHLQKEYATAKAGGIEIVAIDVGEPKERVEKFVDKIGLEFPMLLDKDSRVASAYNLVGIPTYILIDAQGKIKARSHNLPDDYAQLLKINPAPSKIN